MLFRHLQRSIYDPFIPLSSLVQRKPCNSCWMGRWKSRHFWYHWSHCFGSLAKKIWKIQEIHHHLHVRYTLLYLGSMSAMVLFYPLLETGILILASLVSAYNSFFLIPLVPIMLELACEIGFPVAEGTATGMLFAMGNFAGFLLGMFLTMIVRG